MGGGIIINQKELKGLLNYDPDSGIFTWASNRRHVKPGDVAGCMDDGYIRIKINGKIYGAHRLAWLYMTGEWPKHQIDHENHIRSDNKWENLVEATNQENTKNRSIQKRNKSGVTGVIFHGVRRYWEAKITVNGKLIHLHQSKDKFEAICARLSANNKYGFHSNHGRKSC